MYASRDLRNEHEAILTALGILERMIGGETGERPLDPGDAGRMVDFLKTFADTCHHGKEEGFLFPEYERRGVPRERGPIGAMLAEHEKGRAFIRAMSGALAGSPDAKAFAAAARDYIDLLRGHIARENEVLFPLGDPKLPEETHAAVLKKFEEFEEKVIGGGRHEEFHALLDALVKKYA
jgi:hemerythrin-like domain-containing protein